MKQKKTIKEIRIEPLPFFKNGSLVYARSEHELELSDKHYRCRKHCKTSSGEKQIKKEDLQKKFTYFAQKFRLEQKEAVRVGDDLINKYLVSLLLDFDVTLGKQEILDATVRVMDEDLKNIKTVQAEDKYYKTGKFRGGGKIKKGDIKDFEGAFVGKQRDVLPQQLFAVLLSYLKTLSDPRFAKHLGQGLALISMKIHLSNDGKILKIEFERWGWYILNYIDKHIPNYLNNLKKKGLTITNGYDEITDMEIGRAVRYFEGSNFLDAMNWFDVDSLYKLFEACRGVTKSMKGSPEDIQKATLDMMDFMNTNPLAQFASGLLPAVGKVKIKKK